jgi:hypothetical protein
MFLFWELGAVASIRLQPQECKHRKQHEPPPVPYVPNKDEDQREASKLRNLQIITSLEMFFWRRTPPSTFRVAQEWDLRSFSHACDGGTECHQEAWYFQGL